MVQKLTFSCPLPLLGAFRTTQAAVCRQVCCTCVICLPIIASSASCQVTLHVRNASRNAALQSCESAQLCMKHAIVACGQFKYLSLGGKASFSFCITPGSSCSHLAALDIEVDMCNTFSFTYSCSTMNCNFSCLCRSSFVCCSCMEFQSPPQHCQGSLETAALCTLQSLRCALLLAYPPMTQPKEFPM